MGKSVALSAYNLALAKIGTGTIFSYCSNEPANFAGIAAVKLAEKTGLTPASNGAADGVSGAYTFAASAANANGKVGRKVTFAAQTAVPATATGICNHLAIHDGTDLLFTTEAGAITNTGTAQAGAASTITLAAGATATDDIYNGYGVRIVSGAGSGQTRIISDYVGATKVATVSAAWTVQPTSASVYEVFGYAMTAAGEYNIASVEYNLLQP